MLNDKFMAVTVAEPYMFVKLLKFSSLHFSTYDFLMNYVTGILPLQFCLACRSVSETGHYHFLAHIISVGYNPGHRFKHLQLKNV